MSNYVLHKAVGNAKISLTYFGFAVCIALCIGCTSANQTDSEADASKVFKYLVNSNIKSAWLTAIGKPPQRALHPDAASKLLGEITRDATLSDRESPLESAKYELSIQSGNSPYTIRFNLEGKSVIFEYEGRIYSSGTSSQLDNLLHDELEKEEEAKVSR